MAERDELGDMGHQGPWEREDEEHDVPQEDAPEEEDDSQ
jgi:hypothetical protein